MIVKNATKEMKLNFAVKISNYTFKKILWWGEVKYDWYTKQMCIT